MNAIAFVAALLLALVGQFINRSPNVPVEAVKLGLAVAGAGLYAALVSHPTAWPPDPKFASWFDDALLWSFALPGMASLIGMAPGMKTNSKEVP